MKAKCWCASLQATVNATGICSSKYRPKQREVLAEIQGQEEEVMINLQDFVAETIKQIVNGVAISQQHAETVGAYVNPPLLQYASGVLKVNTKTLPEPTMIEFDIAVTTTESDNLKGGMGIFVTGIGIGYQGQKESLGSEVSRIKFSIPLVLPTQKVSRNQSAS